MRKILTLLIVCFALPAAAADTPAMDVQHFQPHADRKGWYATHSADALDLWQPAFGLWFSYARDPLQFELPDGTRESVVGYITTLDLQAAIGFGFADLAVDVPLHLRLAGDGLGEIGSDAFAATTVGDIRLIPKISFLDPDEVGLGLGVVLPLTLPSGSEGNFTGRSTVAFQPAFAVTGLVGPVRLGANVGARVTRSETVQDLSLGNAFMYAAGVGFQVHPVLVLQGEVFGEVHSQDRNNPVEWLAGAAFEPVPGLGIHIGAGTSLGHGVGAPEGRLVFGLGYTVTPPGDRDGDGLLDNHDYCPDDPETVNGFEDSDGCPDDADADGDGIPDSEDECADVPEDRDNFEDEDGCPEGDNDGDGIPDEDDRCRNEAEVLNGVDDDDGCPDEGLVLLDKARNEIIIYEMVYFELGRAVILPASHRVLDAVKDVLEAHPEIRKMEIQGHTDKQGTADSNMKLSQERADSVRDYLIGRGIAGTRLTAVGYGESKLIEPGDDDAAHARNRRVQFIVLAMD